MILFHYNIRLLNFCVAVSCLLPLYVQCTLPADYTSRSAMDKQAVLWQQITDSAYDNIMMDLPTQDYNMANFSNALSPKFDSVSYLYQGDEFPTMRKKLVHTFGSVCMVQLNITAPDSPFTGVFKSGGIGLLRMSPAAQNTTDITVGLGLKILIDGQNSQNFLLLWRRAGQGADRNFFAKEMRNVIPKLPATAIDPIFEAAILLLPGGPSENPENGLNVPLYEQASIMSDGTTVDNVTAPYLVTLTPNRDLGWDSNDAIDYRRHLADIPTGTCLYDVYARYRKTDPDMKIGELLTTGNFVASTYGDHKLFFNHARMPWRP